MCEKLKRNAEKFYRDNNIFCFSNFILRNFAIFAIIFHNYKAK